MHDKQGILYNVSNSSTSLSKLYLGGYNTYGVFYVEHPCLTCYCEIVNKMLHKC